MTIRPLFAAVLLSGTVAFLAPSAAEAKNWGAAESGTFDGLDNQWNGVPGSTDSAIFSGYTAPLSQFTVTLTKDVVNLYIRLDGANPFDLTLDLAGYNYTASGSDGAIAHSANMNGNKLIVKGGGAFNVGTFVVGRGTNSSGTLVLQGESTMETSGDLWVGSSGTGVFEITGGSKFNSLGQVRVGRMTAVSGKVLVSGIGSELTGAKEIFFASNQSGAAAELTVEGGGKVATTGSGTDGTIFFAATAGSTATVLITGENSRVFSSAGGMAIGGTRTDARGTAEVTVSDQGTLEAATTLFLYATSSLTVDGGTVLAKSFGTSTNGVGGEIILTLAGSAKTTASVRISQDLFLDASTSKLTLTLANGVAFTEEDVIHLIDYKGALTGTFSNYSEGQIVTLGDTQFSFSYTMGVEGNRFIGLAAIPEPGSVGLLLMGGVLAGVGVIRLKARRKL